MPYTFHNDIPYVAAASTVGYNSPAYSEKTIHQLWFSRRFAPNQTTVDGKRVEIVSTGLPNWHSGPDVFNAMVKIDGLLWAGNVEFHVRASDWYRHNHHTDSAYDSVVLHVILYDDAVVKTSKGLTVEQMVLESSHLQRIVASATDNTDITTDSMTNKNNASLLRCVNLLPQMDTCRLNIWLEQLMVQRLERKTTDIDRLLKNTMNDWDEAFYVTLMRNLGFSTNADAFEMLARRLPLKVLCHHRNDLMQLEALLFGVAGMLEEATDEYSSQLQREYQFLQHKFSLNTMDASAFKHLRMRPGNFPEVRLAQMAQILYHHDRLFSELKDAPDNKAIAKTLRCGVSDYWTTHYRFGVESPKSGKMLSVSSVQNVVINTLVPFLFCYGKHYRKDELCDKVFDILASLPAEKNSVVEHFVEAGVTVEHAGHSQAVIELFRSYCEKNECHRCEVGQKFFTIKPSDSN